MIKKGLEEIKKNNYAFQSSMDYKKLEQDEEFHI